MKGLQIKIRQLIDNKNNFIIGLMYIHKASISNETLNQIKDRLTIKEQNYHGGIDIVEAFYEIGEYILIPKYYESVYERLNIHFEYKYECEGISIEIESKFPPRNKAQGDVIQEFLNEENTAIIKAPPGFGKTYVAITIACILKRKTLILLDNEKLAKQWVSDFLKFSTLSKDDIRIISGANECKSKNLNQAVTVLLVQTASSVAKKNLFIHNNEILNELVEAKFGYIVLDEIHKSFGSHEFSKAAILLNSKKVLGLSATPKKTSKNNTKVLMSYFNNKIITPEYEKKSKIHLQIFEFTSSITPKTMKYINFRGKFDLNKYQKKIIECPNYLNAVSIITKALIEKEKQIIYLAHTKNILTSMIEHLVEEGILNRENVGLGIAGCDDSELDKPVVFSTYKMLTAGLSINSMDTLFYLTPPGAHSTAIEQSTGRIDRDHNDSVTKNTVIDLVDKNSPQLSSRIKARLMEYERLNIILERYFEITPTGEIKIYNNYS